MFGSYKIWVKEDKLKLEITIEEQGDAAIAILKTEPMVVERFSEIPELGRFILARDGKNIGAGVVLETGI